jgi:hypothetical protein
MFNKILGLSQFTPISNVKKSEKQFKKMELQADTFEKRTITFTGENERENLCSRLDKRKATGGISRAKEKLQAYKSLKATGVTSPREAYKISQSKEYLQIGLAAAGVVGGTVLANIAMASAIAKTNDVAYDKLFPDNDGKHGLGMSVDTNNQTFNCKDFNFHADAKNGIISKTDAGIDIRPERFTEIDKEHGIYRNAEKGIDIDLLHNKYIDNENGINIDLSKNVAEVQTSNGHMVNINPDLITAQPSFEGVHQYGTVDYDPREFHGHDNDPSISGAADNVWDFFKHIMHSEKSDYVLDDNGHIHQGDTIPTYDQHSLAQLDPHIDSHIFAAFLHPTDDQSNAFENNDDNQSDDSDTNNDDDYSAL